MTDKKILTEEEKKLLSNYFKKYSTIEPNEKDIIDKLNISVSKVIPHLETMSYTHVIRLLKEKPATILHFFERKDPLEKTILHYAAKNPEPQVFQFVLDTIVRYYLDNRKGTNFVLPTTKELGEHAIDSNGINFYNYLIKNNLTKSLSYLLNIVSINESTYRVCILSSLAYRQGKVSDFLAGIPVYNEKFQEYSFLAVKILREDFFDELAKLKNFNKKYNIDLSFNKDNENYYKLFLIYSGTILRGTTAINNENSKHESVRNNHKVNFLHYLNLFNDIFPDFDFNENHQNFQHSYKYNLMLQTKYIPELKNRVEAIITHSSKLVLNNSLNDISLNNKQKLKL